MRGIGTFKYPGSGGGLMKKILWILLAVVAALVLVCVLWPKQECGSTGEPTTIVSYSTYCKCFGKRIYEDGGNTYCKGICRKSTCTSVSNFNIDVAVGELKYELARSAQDTRFLVLWNEYSFRLDQPQEIIYVVRNTQDSPINVTPSIKCRLIAPTHLS
jgi:hypothetical protein